MWPVDESVKPWSGLRTVIVHDWLTGMRGGEKVLEAICRLVPDAPILTLVSRPEALGGSLAGRKIRKSIVNYLPLSGTRYREYLPLFPAVIEQFDLDDVDLVISTLCKNPDREKVIDRAFVLACSRQPTTEERSAMLGFLKRHKGTHAEAVVDLCHALLNVNEFLYVD